MKKKIFKIFQLRILIYIFNTFAMPANAVIWSVVYVFVDAPRTLKQSLKTDGEIEESWVAEKADGGPLVNWEHVMVGAFKKI